MAKRKQGGRRSESGTSGGTDVEPLQGGMKEQEGGLVDPRRETEAPYHDLTVPEGGLAPRGAPAPEGGSAPRKGTPPEPGEHGESAKHADQKIDEEQRSYEREGGNAPRHEPT